ncbi:MAG: hypothetical protein ACTHJ1_12585 [Bordetella sp.]|uniref:hypothetical protein n=1 Tax=Bordetella sp. TaxID=28081 RepID=UPI003F7CA0FB
MDVVFDIVFSTGPKAPGYIPDCDWSGLIGFDGKGIESYIFALAHPIRRTQTHQKGELCIIARQALISQDLLSGTEHTGKARRARLALDEKSRTFGKVRLFSAPLF